ncbi:hypothetical protein VTJ83DRAFT_6422 [Remersonia thermophila]|uniref:[histone H3]-trimethyl-L-lysine(9) demethylase n=1 Tax=Remersonia thermophila TaxID=72144 RepID=A0ABR4D6Y6_9PEZI
MSAQAIGALASTVDADSAAAVADISKPAGLHSPPDSNGAMDVDESDSELSDLDELESKLDGALGDESSMVNPDPAPAPQPQPPADDKNEDDDDDDDADEDIGEILPDHWSGTVPVFKPTMKQFRDFKRFMEKVDKYGMKSGIIKIIAPQEWKDSLPPIDDLIKRIRVREPIRQEIMGSNGTYRQVNILHQRTYNLPQWRQLCDQSEHQPPARRGERRLNADRKPTTRSRAPAPTPKPAPAKSTPTKRRKGGRATRRSARFSKEEPEEEEDRPMTPVSPAPERDEVAKSVEDEPDIKEEQCDDDEESTPAPRRMGFARQSKSKTQSVSARRKYIRREGSAAIDEKAFENFDYHMDISEFTPERCEELERIYWKTLTYAPPLYGADLPGTLFDDSVKIWNLNKLPNLLDVLGTKVPGVNTAYLYLGMWKATFAWHLEDVDLYSINYLHFGAPKQWYSISQADARRFEAAMKSIWPQEAKACDQFLRHKGFLISPSHLKQQYNITVNKCVSYPGEFVVTYPYGYHSGFNLGYNCAEAVNFALDTWLPMGKIAKKCQCAQAQDSVWVDVYEIERKLRGEETEYEETEDEEDEDEEDEDEQETGLPSPPSSHTVRVKATGRKRKRGVQEKEPKAKKKKIRLRLKAHAEPPCCLCPNDIPGAEIIPTDDGRKAHRMCALYLPETYIEEVDGSEVVANAGGIDKARLDLKCLYCRSKRGACLQCSHKKCSRSYHATCAQAAGVLIEEGEVPVFGEDGTEYKEQAFEFSCRFHRTKRDRKLDGDALANHPEIRAAASALKKNDICQLQYFRGEIFAGVVVENRHDEEMLLLDIIPNGERVEVEWKWLLLPDPADLRLPKASANAIPMPTCRKAQRKINAKRAVNEAPRKDDEFGDGFTWAEFHTCDPFRNKSQVKVDLTKEDQVWHYLGEPSTEAKAQYTEDPSRPRYNPKGNFLDTLPKPAPPPRMVAPAPPGTYPASQLVPGASHGAFKPKPEKPYIYKPRKPIAPSSGQQHATTFTSHTFAVNPVPPPAPVPQQQFQPPQDFRPIQMAAPPPPQSSFQHVFHQQPGPSASGKQQPLQPSGPSRQGLSAPNSSDRFPPVGGHFVQPQPTNWSSPAGTGTSAPLPAPMTSSFTPGAGVPHPGPPGEHPQAFAYQNDPARHLTPYGRWGGFTNGYEGNVREFLIKAQKALSGGSNKHTTNHIPASTAQPLQPRPSGSAPTAGYAPILPRPPVGGASPAPSPHMQGATLSPSSGLQSHPTSGVPIAPAGQPGMLQPGPVSQFSAQPASQHVWQSVPQPQHHAAPPQQPAPAPKKAKKQPQPLAKQSHSPIPLPPYVRQMAAAAPSAPATPAAATASQGQKAAAQAVQEAPAPLTSSISEQSQTTSEAAPPPALAMTANNSGPVTESTKQPQGPEAPKEEAPPFPPSSVPADAAGTVQETPAELVQKMMINLRRASQNLGSALGQAEEGGAATGPPAES